MGLAHSAPDDGDKVMREDSERSQGNKAEEARAAEQRRPRECRATISLNAYDTTQTAIKTEALDKVCSGLLVGDVQSQGPCNLRSMTCDFPEANFRLQVSNGNFCDGHWALEEIQVIFWAS